MMAQISCLFLFLLVAGLQCAPAKVGTGFDIGGNGEASFTAGASGRGNLEDGVFKGGATGLLGVNGKGGLNAGGFARYNDKILGANGELHGSGGLLGKSAFDGEIGKGKDGFVIGGTNRLTGANEFKLGASGNAATNEDAKDYVRVYGNRSALDDLRNNY